jgi:RNA methyltransferase, TrmH family
MISAVIVPEGPRGEPLPEVVISSPKNEQIRRLRQAIESHDDEFALEGPKFVADAIEAGWTPTLLVVAERLGDSWRQHRPLLVTDALFERITATRADQGVIALFPKRHTELSGLRSDGLIVALDGIQDPGNVGTILRLCVAFDAAAICVLPGSADPFQQKSLRASAGAIGSATIEELLTWSSARGLPIYAATANGEQTQIDAPAILVLGNEGRGVDDRIAGQARSVAIRTSGKVESINVATAAAILLSRSFEHRMERNLR